MLEKPQESIYGWTVWYNLAHDLPRCGFINILRMVLQLRQKGLLMGGPPCGSWIWVNRSTSKRSRTRIFGSTARSYVKDANANPDHTYCVFWCLQSISVVILISTWEVIHPCTWFAVNMNPGQRSLVQGCFCWINIPQHAFLNLYHWSRFSTNVCYSNLINREFCGFMEIVIAITLETMPWPL